MNLQETFEKDKEGIKDTTVNDFLLPLLLARLPLGLASKAPAAKAPVQLAEDAYGTPLREAMMESMSMPAKGYAMGGVVTPDDMGQIPMPNEKVPQGTAPNPIQGILAQAQGLGAQMSGQYTPQMRNQLYSAMLERQNSVPQGIGVGLASVGDAIARGYGQSNSDFLNNTLKSQKDTTTEGLGAFDTSAKMNMQQTNAGLELGRMDPTSDISRLHQEAYSEALKKLGYTPDAIAKMPASQIEMLAQVGLKRADIESQNELKKATIELQAMMGNANIKNEIARRRLDAANAYGKRGIVKKLTDAISESPETKVLREEMGNSTGTAGPVKVDSVEEYNALPAGTHYVDSYGTEKVKN